MNPQKLTASKWTGLPARRNCESGFGDQHHPKDRGTSLAFSFHWRKRVHVIQHDFRYFSFLLPPHSYFYRGNAARRSDSARRRAIPHAVRQSWNHKPEIRGRQNSIRFTSRMKPRSATCGSAAKWRKRWRDFPPKILRIKSSNCRQRALAKLCNKLSVVYNPQSWQKMSTTRPELTERFPRRIPAPSTGQSSFAILLTNYGKCCPRASAKQN